MRSQESRVSSCIFLQSAVTQPASRFSNRVSPIQYWDWLPQSNDQWVNDRSDFTAFTFPTEPEAREWRGSTLPQMCITSEQSKRKISGIFDQLCNQHIWFFSCFINHLCWEHLGQRIVVQLLSHVWLWLRGPQRAVLPCLSLSPTVCSNLCPLYLWCHPTIWSSIAPFSFCPQSLPASGSFPMSWLFTSGGQSIGVSTSASGLPMNIQGWFPLGLASSISLLSKGLSKSLLQHHN